MNKPLLFTNKDQVKTIFWLLMIMFCGAVHAEEEYIGIIKTYQPIATVLHGGAKNAVDVGRKLYLGDTVVTESDGAVGIIFLDGSVLSLGPETHFEIVDFLFKPAERNVSFISKVSKGTAAFTSGAIGRIAPETVKFITPSTTLQLHGTKILIEVD